MNRLECWAEIPNDQERKSVMSWIRSNGFNSYSEIGERVSATYICSQPDNQDSSKIWGIIHFFEHYPEHGICGHNT